MKIADMIKQGLKEKGYPNLKVASKALGISPEILRVVINKGHIPQSTIKTSEPPVTGIF